MAWSVRMSPAAREDINAMFHAAFETAIEIIAKGQPQPFGVLLDNDGRILIQHVNPPPGWNSADLVRHMAESIYQRADTLQAALLVQHTGDNAFPTMQGYGDHRDATGFSFFITWRSGYGGPATIADISVEPANAQLFR